MPYIGPYGAGDLLIRTIWNALILENDSVVLAARASIIMSGGIVGP